VLFQKLKRELCCRHVLCLLVIIISMMLITSIDNMIVVQNGKNS